LICAKEILIGAAGCIIVTTALSLVLVNMISASTYSNVVTTGAMGHSMSTNIQEMCQSASGMPPHYCDPTYHVMSSVPGIKIDTVEPVSNTEVKVIIKEDNSDTKVSQRLVLVGGSGYLSGATIIEDGWDKSIVHLRLDGTGTIYDFGQMHLHLFPYTKD
jgi:hypothetical protein